MHQASTANIIEDFIDINNGTTEVVRAGIDFGKVTNIVYANTDLATRDYQALVLQTRFKANNRWSFSGHYTLMLKDEGNDEGDAATQSGATSPIGNYPEFSTLRDMFRVEGCRTSSDPGCGSGASTISTWAAPGISVSGLWRVDSGQVFSLRASNQPMTATQVALLAAAGYPDSRRAGCVFRRTRLAAISR